MDGRRHSVDIPISRTLIALRRVRSLRDPSTHSASKLSAFIDNLKWETNSNNAITLGFDNSEHELYYDSKHCNSEMLLENNTMGGKYFKDHDDGGSCDEQDETSSQNEGPDCNIWRRELEESSRVTNGDILSRFESPRLSMQGIGFTGSCNQGCGIGSCWSRTRRFRDDSNFERRPLLLTGESPYLESDRNICQKFMPKSFSELVGQNTIATSLSNAISNKQINCLYLFHGPRGTGKTSASRIFAAALNCLSSNTANRPCGSCHECSLIFSGRSRDFKEVDALRMNKTKRCRTFVNSLWAPPFFSRFKVYVVDECHILDREAWAIISSAVDELPRNVVLIAVTPNLDKVSRGVVLKSRVYCFQRVKEVDIVSRLKKICFQEGIEVEEDALYLIANKSNGSVRDAEMMFDQLSSIGKKITVSLVYEVNGVVSNNELLDLLHLALSSDAVNTVKMARELMRSRIEPLQLVSQLANLIMDILAGNFPDGVSDFRMRLFGTDNSEADMHLLSHALRILCQTEKQLRMSKNQTTWLTVALLQLSSAESSNDMTGTRLNMRTLNTPEGDCYITSSTSDSLRFPVACACDEDEPAKIGKKDNEETLELVWLRAIGICKPRSFRKFLRKRGKLISLSLMHGIGTSVAELEFDRSDYVTKAEKSWKVIAGALQHMLGYNVELRINLANKDTNNKHLKLKKLCFGLFNCSRRAHLKSHLSSECKSSTSENSDSTPTIRTTYKYVEKCSSECGSQISHTCCHGKELFKSIRSKNGNALSISIGIDDELAVQTWGEQIDKGGPNSVGLKPEIKHSREEYLKFRCWKTAMFPFRKAWQLRHQAQGRD